MARDYKVLYEWIPTGFSRDTMLAEDILDAYRIVELPRSFWGIWCPALCRGELINPWSHRPFIHHLWGKIQKMESDYSALEEKNINIERERDMLVQTSGELCPKCGWSMVIPGVGCLKCQRDMLVEELKACVQEFEHLCDDGTIVRKFVNQHPTMIRARAALAKVKGVE